MYGVQMVSIKTDREVRGRPAAEVEGGFGQLQTAELEVRLSVV